MWHLVRFLYLVHHHLTRIRKFYKVLQENLILKELIFFLEKKRDIHKIENIYISALVFLVIKTKKSIHSMFQKLTSKDMLIYY